MNSKILNDLYEEKKEYFHSYIDSIKKSSVWDIYTIINTTLIKNPYATKFPNRFFSNTYTIENKLILFIKSSIKFYLRQLYFFVSYCLSFLLFKIYYKKSGLKIKNQRGIDIFFLVDNIIKDKQFNENYFIGLYEILDKYDKNYVFLPRLYGVNKNPFKLIKLFKILNEDKRDFLFEFELLTMKDFFLLLLMIIVYPFKTLRLLQTEKLKEDILFNNELIKDIGSFSFDSFTRFVYGKNIAKLKKINKIYSWSEFQVVDRAFNFGIRKNSDEVKLIACQFYLNYETYFNSYVDDLDFEMLSSPHKVLVNGKYYIKKRKKVKYDIGIALRYKNLFEFNCVKDEKNILLLGSYIEEDTRYMLTSVEELDNIIFKNHPAVDILKFGRFQDNITISNDNIYKLFQNTELVIGTASGTSVEAVTCGISVIIIASQDNLTANPLVDYGKGKIWDIAFNKDDVKRLYNQLIKYRKNNIDEIQEIASWYKENFFVEPTQESIVKAFQLDKDNGDYNDSKE